MREIIVEALALVITGLATAVLLQIRKYVSAKLRKDAVDAAMTRITHTTQTVVDGLAQTMVSDLKASGMFGPRSSSATKKKAFDTVIKRVPTATLKIAEGVITDLPDFIGDKIEQAVIRGKAQYTLPSLAAPPPSK